MSESGLSVSGKGMELTLPSSWYTEERIYTLEREHIFMREWICVAREEELPAAGDLKVLDLYGESILLLRNREGALRAYYNVCRHRGARLCAMGEQENSPDRLPLRGGVSGGDRITCPYHAWTYDLDGQLQHAPHMDGVSGFRLDDIRLHTVGCQSWGGFIFVNLTPDTAPSFAAQVAAADRQFQRYPLAELRIGRTIHYAVDANWKVLCENYNECYHCGPVHPELCQIVPAFRQAGGAGLDWEIGIPHREGAMTFTASGLTTRRTFPGLSETEKNHHKGELVYPNLFLSVASDHVAAFILKANSAGHSSIDCHFLFEPYEMNKAGFDPADAVDFWHLVNRQDWSICERVQQGMRARVHRQGMFSPMEDWNLDIRRYVSDRIARYVDS